MACVCSDSGGATNNQESVNILIELAAWECNSKYFRSLMRSISASFDPPPTPPPNHFTGWCCYCWPWLYCNHPIRCQFPNQLRSFTFYMIDRHPFHRSISLSPLSLLNLWLQLGFVFTYLFYGSMLFAIGNTYLKVCALVNISPTNMSVCLSSRLSMSYNGRPFSSTYSSTTVTTVQLPQSQPPPHSSQLSHDCVSMMIDF